MLQQLDLYRNHWINTGQANCNVSGLHLVHAREEAFKVGTHSTHSTHKSP